MFEKSWRVLARGGHGSWALALPPRPRISVIRCKANVDLLFPRRTGLGINTPASCYVEREHKSNHATETVRVQLAARCHARLFTMETDISTLRFSDPSTFRRPLHSFALALSVKTTYAEKEMGSPK